MRFHPWVAGRSGKASPDMKFPEEPELPVFGCICEHHLSRHSREQGSLGQFPVSTCGRFVRASCLGLEKYQQSLPRNECSKVRRAFLIRSWRNETRHMPHHAIRSESEGREASRDE